MNRSKITISLPDNMRKFVESKTKENGYGSISEYFRELIRLDQRMDLAGHDARIRERQLEEMSFSRNDLLYWPGDRRTR